MTEPVGLKGILFVFLNLLQDSRTSANVELHYDNGKSGMNLYVAGFVEISTIFILNFID